MKAPVTYRPPFTDISGPYAVSFDEIGAVTDIMTREDRDTFLRNASMHWVYPDLVFCTLPEDVEGSRVTFGFESRNGMFDLAGFVIEGDHLQGIAPLKVCSTIEAGIRYLDSLNPPTAADLVYIASL